MTDKGIYELVYGTTCWTVDFKGDCFNFVCFLAVVNGDDFFGFLLRRKSLLLRSLCDIRSGGTPSISTMVSSWLALQLRGQLLL